MAARTGTDGLVDVFAAVETTEAAFVKTLESVSVSVRTAVVMLEQPPFLAKMAGLDIALHLAAQGDHARIVILGFNHRSTVEKDGRWTKLQQYDDVEIIFADIIQSADDLRNLIGEPRP